MIRGTDFGIDLPRSFWRVVNDGEENLVTIEVRGDSTRLREVQNAHPSWDWTLYPPHLYVRAFPVHILPDHPEVAIAEIEDKDLDGFDVALYLIEHWDVVNMQIRVDRHTLNINGSVACSDGLTPLEITWTNTQ